MKKRSYLLMLILLLASLLPRPTLAESQPRLIAFYFPFWNDYRSDKIPYDQLTEIFHNCINAHPDGTLDIPVTYLEPALITRAHAHGVKVLTSIGGSGVTVFSILAANPTLTATFVDNLYRFIRDNGYDGVDFDWEFPNSDTDAKNAIPFFKAIRQKFDNSPAPAPSWEITLDVAADAWWGKWVDYPKLTPLLTYINCMSYDGTGTWVGHSSFNSPVSTDSTPYPADSSVKAELDYLIDKRGVPAAKINEGFPFYGMEIPNVTGPYQDCGKCENSVVNFYTQVLDMIGKPWKENWDEKTQEPYLTDGPDQKGFVTYENPRSIAIKTAYAVNTRKVGGVFMWHIALDAMPDNSHPLLKAMFDTLHPAAMSKTP